MAADSYQAVIAGRVREDEGIGFFSKNQIATPARVTAFSRTGGAVKEPVLAKDHLNHEGIGKTGESADNAMAYGTGSNNVD